MRSLIQYWVEERRSEEVSAYTMSHYVTVTMEMYGCIIQVCTASPERKEPVSLAVGRERQVNGHKGF